MIAIWRTLSLDKGASFSAKCYAIDDYGQAIDLSTYNASASMIKSAAYSNLETVVLNATITDAVNGEVTISLSSVITEVLNTYNINRYEYEVVVTDTTSGSDNVMVIQRGIIEVNG